MAKGNTCPGCGGQTMHKEDGGVYKCSSCGAVGWWKKPEGPGGGKGSKCKNCGKQQLHTLYEGSKFTIRYCSNADCGATVVS